MKRKKFIIICLFFILIAGIVTFKFRPRNQGLYKVTILPSLGGDFTLPCSINDKGQVTGFSEVSKGNYNLFIWDKENGTQDLGKVAQRDIFINNKGQIAAGMNDPNGSIYAFIWDPNTGKTILPTLGGKNIYVRGINRNGQIVGAAETSEGIDHAFIWDAVNGMRDLTPEDTGKTGAFCINDLGQMVISVNNSIAFVDRNEDSENDEYTTIPIFGIIPMNNNGYVVGTVPKAKNKYDVITWHKKAGIQNIFKSDTGSTSYEINDLNQITITEGRDKIYLFGKYLYTPKNKNLLIDPNLGRISLDEYISLDKNERLTLRDINNNGCIIGAIQSTKDSKSIGVLFEPIPEKMERLIKNKKSHK
jgi:probable HAF family extracellular repeat protein